VQTELNRSHPARAMHRLDARHGGVYCSATTPRGVTTLADFGARAIKLEPKGPAASQNVGGLFVRI
jgi:hypothetical protein